MSLHKLKPHMLCSQGILELCSVILSSDDHFGMAVHIDAHHGKQILYNGMNAEVF